MVDGEISKQVVVSPLGTDILSSRALSLSLSRLTLVQPVVSTSRSSSIKPIIIVIIVNIRSQPLAALIFLFPSQLNQQQPSTQKPPSSDLHRTSKGAPASCLDSSCSYKSCIKPPDALLLSITAITRSSALGCIQRDRLATTTTTTTTLD